MADFTPINTQEEFDAAVSERIKREADKYAKYTSPDDLEKIKANHKSEIEKLNEANKAKLKEKDDAIAERDVKIKNYATSSAKLKIARETGLSYEAMEYIQGDDEDAMKKSAQQLKALIGKTSGAPLKSTEDPTGDSKTAAYKKMSRELKGED